MWLIIVENVKKTEKCVEGAWKILRDRVSEKCPDRDISDSQTSHIVYEVHCDGTQNDQT